MTIRALVDVLLAGSYVFSALTCSIGVQGLLKYADGTSPIGWFGTQPSMALATALGLTLMGTVGLALTYIAARHEQESRRKNDRS